MHKAFSAAALRHIAVEPERGDAALTVVAPQDFASAEIMEGQRHG